jgi:proteasome lid subunit RPN8/RPN11
MKNILHSPNEFAMDINDMQETFHHMKEQGESFLGIYHSHPTSAPYPSQLDIRYASYPEAAYIILSFQRNRPVVRCYHIHQRNVSPLSITTF